MPSTLTYLQGPSIPAWGGVFQFVGYFSSTSGQFNLTAFVIIDPTIWRLPSYGEVIAQS